MVGRGLCGLQISDIVQLFLPTRRAPSLFFDIGFLPIGLYHKVLIVGKEQALIIPLAMALFSLPVSHDSVT